jgi:hypothetical protein
MNKRCAPKKAHVSNKSSCTCPCFKWCGAIEEMNTIPIECVNHNVNNSKLEMKRNFIVMKHVVRCFYNSVIVFFQLLKVFHVCKL